MHVLKNTNIKWPVNVGETTTTTTEATTAEGCLFFLTPKLPGEEGETIGKNDRTSYRISYEWFDDFPPAGLRIRYEVYELSGVSLELMGIKADFSFNPVAILQPTGSHLLNIETEGAAEGPYVLKVVATVDDPGWKGPPCSADALVFLYVSEDSITRLNLPTMGSVGSIQGDLEIIKGESGENSQASTGSEINVGDTLVTGSDGDTVIGIESKGGLVQLGKETSTTLVGLERRTDSHGTEVVVTLLPRATACQGLSGSALVRCDLFYENLAERGIPERLAPEFLGTAVLLSLWEGVVHWHSGDYVGDLSLDWILTRNVAISPRGTEFTVEVASDGTTTVSTLEGSVEVVDLVSGDSVFVWANQRLVLPEVGGLRYAAMVSRMTTFDPNTVARWWAPQPLFQAQALSIGLPVAAAALIAAIGTIALKRRSRRLRSVAPKPPTGEAVSTSGPTTERPRLPRPKWNRRPRTILFMGLLLSLVSFSVAVSQPPGPVRDNYLVGTFLLGLIFSVIVAPIKLAIDKLRDRRRKRISPAMSVGQSAALSSKEPRYCRHCGQPLPSDSGYCGQCGKKQ